MKAIQGKVVSVIDASTAVVEVQSLKLHPRYRKRILRTKTYIVGSNENVKKNDLVNIVETRPISKRKKWKVQDIVGK
jgi:small subunit ribosomal protein S17